MFAKQDNPQNGRDRHLKVQAERYGPSSCQLQAHEQEQRAKHAAEYDSATQANTVTAIKRRAKLTAGLKDNQRRHP
jgi:hypothetical protein